MYPIGYVRSPIKQLKPSEQQGDLENDYWQKVESEVIIHDNLVPALDGIERFSHVVVLWWMHQIPEEQRKNRLKVHPRGRQENPLRGVFATRSPVRPNLIGMTVVQLIERKGTVLRVRGLDALDGSPVIDIKPFSKSYDDLQGSFQKPDGV